MVDGVFEADGAGGVHFQEDIVCQVEWRLGHQTNLRLDPYERTGLPNGGNGSLAFYNWFAYEFWRF